MADSRALRADDSGLVLTGRPESDLLAGSTIGLALGVADDDVHTLFSDAFAAGSTAIESVTASRVLELRCRRADDAIVIIVRDVTQAARERDRLLESERNYRLLTERSHDVIARVSPSGQSLYTSPVIQSQLGYTPDELVGRSPFDRFHPDDVAMLFETMQRLLRDRKAQTSVYRTRHKDGHCLWVETISTPVLDPATGGVLEIQTNTREVTSRVEAANALRASEEKYRTTFDAVGEALLVIDDKGEFIASNPSANRLLGVGAGTTGVSADTRPWRILDPSGALVTDPPLLRTLRDGQPRASEEFILERGDGSRSWVTIATAVVSCHSDGRVRAALASCRRPRRSTRRSTHSAP